MKFSESLARAMCRESGFEPDMMVTQQALVQGPFGSQAFPDSDYLVPAWCLYADLARTAISALNKAKIIEE